MDKHLPKLLTIPKTKRIDLPSRMIFVDTESNRETPTPSQVRHTLKLGHAIYWQRGTKKRKDKVIEFPFTNAFDFWEWATGRIARRETVYLFAHNVTFDFLVLDGFRLLPCLDYVAKSVYYKYKTAILRFENDTRRLTIADTMNYFPVKLEELAKHVGGKKIPVDFDTVEDDVLAERCAEDARIVYRAVRGIVEMLAEEQLGSFRLTASGIAASVYRHSFMSNDIVTNHTPEIVALEKSAYTGGVTSVNRLVASGLPDLYKLDVNSMYASVMAENKYPARIMEFVGEVPVHFLERYLSGFDVVARVRLNARSPIYPVRTTEGVAYPVGTITATITTPLLQRALANDEIIAVEQAAAYIRKPLFADYIQEMYARKQEAGEAGDMAGREFFKRLLNALYGKFGQSDTEVKRIGDCPMNEFAMYDAFSPETGERWREMHAGGSVMFIYNRGEARYTSYAIAAHITDFARLKLFDLASLAGDKNVFYMDTDSLIVNADGAARLVGEIHPDDMGRLKVEDTGRVFVGLSKKDYFIGQTRKVKGFTQDGRRIESNVFDTMQNIGFYGAARKNLAGGAWWEMVRKRYNPALRFVNVDRDGIVTPLTFPQDEDKLRRRVETMPIVVDVAKRTLNKSERASIQPLFEMLAR